MRQARCLILLPVLGSVACSTLYTHPDEELAKQGGTATSKIVFVTSALFQGGKLGGVAGADAECGKLAHAAGLAGTFKAWLSSPTSAAADRLTHASAPYALVNGTRIADDWDDFADGLLQHVINLDENGTALVAPADPVTQGKVWTGSEFDGQPYTNEFQDQFEGHFHCSGWTDLHGIGLAGDPRFTSAQWTTDFSPSCTSQAALYCLEQ